jgi:glucose/arabinose dehydrogenase
MFRTLNVDRRLLAALCAAGSLTGLAHAQVTQGELRLTLRPVASGLVSPVKMVSPPDTSGRLFIAEQNGPIKILINGTVLETPFLDLTAETVVVNTGYDERGVLGMAFHPDYATNGRFFVRYSRPRPGKAGEPCFGTPRGCHEEVLAAFTVSSDPNIANPTGTILFRVDEPQFNHNGGDVAFGPDGMLYFTLGDGGGANDGLADNPPSHGPIGNAQNLETPLGKVIRIDVDAGEPYGIPADNPFVDAPGLDEIWAYGLRHPFSFSFDDTAGGTGELWLPDVGQNLFEEINIGARGANYGWPIREGRHCFDPFNPNTPPATCDTTGLTEPIAEYGHDVGLAVVAGYVYRGSRFPALVGKFVFGDFSTAFNAADGHLFLIDTGERALIQRPRLGAMDAPLGLYIKGFGRDADGEIYLLASSRLGPAGDGGQILHITKCPSDWQGDATINSQDFFDFLSDFFNNDADFNNDAITNSQDFFDFLKAFFAGC